MTQSNEQYSRTVGLLGEAALVRLKNARVAVFGIGGVGGYVAEALARCGVGAIDLIDHDTVSLSNINRQLVALHSTVGRLKVEVMAGRIHDIDPTITVTARPVFFLPETEGQFDFSVYDYVVDAIDTVAGKMALIRCAKAAGVPIICSMGAGNKLDPTAFHVADIYDTRVCPLAKVIRGLCRKEGIDRLTVVYSEELPIPAAGERVGGKTPPASVIFPPAAAGLAIAGRVVADLTAQA